MATFNPDFWEVQAPTGYLESVPSTRAMWYETEVDRERRHALQEFFQAVLPAVTDLVDVELTSRQRQILKMYYFEGKTQEEIAEQLCLTQSTVSRHLFGTVRGGKRVGGAIPKLRKAVAKRQPADVGNALAALQQRFAKAS